MEQALPALNGNRRLFFLQRTEIGQICLTHPTADYFRMKLNVVLPLWIERIEQVTAQLAAGRATQTVTAPDRTNAVPTAVTSLTDTIESLTQQRGRTQRQFNSHHLLGIQRFVSEISQVRVANLIHN